VKSKLISKLEAVINYRFNDKSLLVLALTHRSMGKNNNERLEFLGDSIVNLVIAELLFNKFPRATEGQLSRLRSQIVSGSSLAKLGNSFNLSKYIILGVSELKSGGCFRESIISDTVEAIIGAIYLDSNIEDCKLRILEWTQNKINTLTIADGDTKDPKTKLQEYLQKIQQPLPIYIVHKITGDLHNQTFTISCQISLINKEITANGSSKRKAEQKAAKMALKEIEQQTATGKIKPPSAI
jgi:ribonuclease-3